jgi:hypothetical protein
MRGQDGDAEPLDADGQDLYSTGSGALAHATESN